MTETIPMPTQPKYRTLLRTEPGGIPRRVYGARQQLLRDGHALAVQTMTDIPETLPEIRHWAFDVRRGRMSVYGGLLRFLEVLHRRGVPMATALMVPQWIEAYVRELYGDTPTDGALDGGARKAA